jgi:hypothetical protein
MTKIDNYFNIMDIRKTPSVEKPSPLDTKSQSSVTVTDSNRSGVH